MNSIFSCPVCGEKNEREKGVYRCVNGHSFDIAKEGYVNLLFGNRRSGTHGDDKSMILSRTKFLDSGFYEPLKDELCSLIRKTGFDSPTLLDSGCGEGYYTRFYCDTVKAMNGRCAGIDLSKDGIKHSARRCPEGEFAIASVYHIPIKDESVDIVVNCFSPNAPTEFARILKDGGYLFYVVPDENHLWELKSVLYELPYKNPVKEEAYEGFVKTGESGVKTKFTLNSTDEILSLLNMTPYTWKTPKDGVEKLKRLERLEVTAEFRILVYKKHERT